MNDLEEIYKDNYEIVYKYLIVLTHNKDISEELTQETFYRSIKNINKFKGKSKLSTWLCQIAKNLWIDETKKKEVNFYEIDEDKSKINIFKKINKKMKLFKTIILMIVIILLVIYLRRVSIIFLLDSKSKKYDNVSNYHSTSISYLGKGGISETDTYYKDGKFIRIISVEDSKLIEYCDGESVKSLNVYKNGNFTENYINKEEQDRIIQNYNQNYERLGFFANIFMGINYEVYSGRANGRDCYILRNKNFEWFKDKETGRTVKLINYQEVSEKEKGKEISDIITDNYYEEGNITDEIIEEKYLEILKNEEIL